MVDFAKVIKIDKQSDTQEAIRKARETLAKDVGSIDSPKYPALEKYIVDPIQEMEKNTVGSLVAPTGIANFIHKLNYGDTVGNKDRALAALDLAGLGGGAKAIKSTASLFKNAVKDEAPLVQNRLYNEKIGKPEYKPGDTLPKYAHRNIFNKTELKDILDKGYMLPREGASKRQKYFTMSDRALPAEGNRSGAAIRVRSENLSFDRAVSSNDVEVWDNTLEGWIPLKYITRE